MPDVAEELGAQWRARFYSLIKQSLNLDENRDRLSRDTLWEILRPRDAPSLQELRGFEGKTTVVFGSGPSLVSDLAGLRPFLKEKNPRIVAADGAADALAENEFDPDVTVSDLDSCSEATLKKNSEAGFVFAHGHGDNIDLVKKIVPKLGHGTFGTTQVEPRAPIENFGGFTDGDRACFIASALLPSSIILAGMDFGKEEGKFSVNRYSAQGNSQRILKLDWGRKSLEYLISQKTNIRFYNVTKFGLEIAGSMRVQYARFTS
jgi:uncharacterized Rossmann fold enzyme